MYPHWKSSFALLWVGQAFSILTSSISQFALIWYLTAETGSAALLSLATIFAVLPQGILSLFTGSVADRFDRRWIMAIADGAIGLVSLWLALMAWDGSLPLTVIFLALMLRGVGSAFHSPCIQAVTPLIAPPEALTKCAGWSQGIMTVSMLASPALAAILYANLPLAAVILLDTAGAALAVVFLLLARLPRMKVGGGAKLHIIRDSLEGFRVLKSHTWLWQLCLICALFSLTFMPISALYPLMTMGYFALDQNAAALVETLFSVGMLAGSVVLGLWGGFKNRIHSIILAMLWLAFCLLGVAVLPTTAFWGFAVLSLLMAFSAPFFNGPFMALIQEKVEPEYLGRVGGMAGSIMTLASPVGLAVIALWGDKVPLPFWFLLSGAVTLLCGALCLLPAVRRCDRPNP